MPNLHCDVRTATAKEIKPVAPQGVPQLGGVKSSHVVYDVTGLDPARFHCCIPRSKPSRVTPRCAASARTATPASTTPRDSAPCRPLQHRGGRDVVELEGHAGQVFGYRPEPALEVDIVRLVLGRTPDSGGQVGRRRRPRGLCPPHRFSVLLSRTAVLVEYTARQDFVWV